MSRTELAIQLLKIGLGIVGLYMLFRIMVFCGA